MYNRCSYVFFQRERIMENIKSCSGRRLMLISVLYRKVRVKKVRKFPKWLFFLEDSYRGKIGQIVDTNESILSGSLKHTVVFQGIGKSKSRKYKEEDLDFI